MPSKIKVRKTSSTSHGAWAVDALMGDRMGRTQWIPVAWFAEWSKAVAAAGNHSASCYICKDGFAGWHWVVPDDI